VLFFLYEAVDSRISPMFVTTNVFRVSVCCYPFRLLGLLFKPEDRTSTFLRNVEKFRIDYTASHPRRYRSWRQMQFQIVIHRLVITRKAREFESWFRFRLQVKETNDWCPVTVTLFIQKAVLIKSSVPVKTGTQLRHFVSLIRVRDYGLWIRHWNYDISDIQQSHSEIKT
jgi:hypothetical protein